MKFVIGVMEGSWMQCWGMLCGNMKAELVLQQARDERKKDIYPWELSEQGSVSVTRKGTIYL